MGEVNTHPILSKLEKEQICEYTFSKKCKIDGPCLLSSYTKKNISVINSARNW